ncbi:MAG: NAD(P)H-dependent oxidoreductase [Allosphingosinicella sp.]
MTRIAIVDGHPDADRARYVHALADSYAAGAASAGHEVRRIDVARLDFPLLRSQRAWMEEKPVPDIAEAQETLRWAGHVVLLYPLWLGDVPALLKGFLEQTARPDFAFRYRDGGFPEKLLKGRSVRVIVTMGMPAPFYALVYRAHSLKSLERDILRFTGFGPVRHSIVGSVGGSAAHREKWLERVRALGARAA